MIKPGTTSTDEDRSLLKSFISPDEAGDAEFRRYDDGSVLAAISLEGKRSCMIHEFSSKICGVGNGERAIRRMKALYGSVDVNDPGDPVESPDALAFWMNLKAKGLIRRMFDSNGNEIQDTGIEKSFGPRL